MITLIVHLYIHSGQEEAFAQYEEQALSTFREHGGKLLTACRPHAAEGAPYEIHVLQIDSEEALGAFRADPRLQELKDLRERALSRTEIFVCPVAVEYPQ